MDSSGWLSGRLLDYPWQRMCGGATRGPMISGIWTKQNPNPDRNPAGEACLTTPFPVITRLPKGFFAKKRLNLNTYYKRSTPCNNQI
jgi:hypothetical protein